MTAQDFAQRNHEDDIRSVFSNVHLLLQIIQLQVHHPTFLCLSHPHAQVLLTATPILSPKSGRPFQPSYLFSSSRLGAPHMPVGTWGACVSSARVQFKMCLPLPPKNSAVPQSHAQSPAQHMSLGNGSRPETSAHTPAPFTLQQYIHSNGFHNSPQLATAYGIQVTS